LRVVVADQLGVGPDDLTPEVSLREDLAADSLDLVELLIAVEETFGVTLREAMVSDVHSYGDLVERVVAVVGAQRRAVRAELAVPVRTRLTTAARPDRVLERATVLTAYAAQTIVADAARLGPGARLEVVLPAGTSDGVVVQVERMLADIALRGVAVSIERERAGAGDRSRLRA
jgi:acyl carrier protein